MKNIIFLALLCISFAAAAQEKSEEGNRTTIVPMKLSVAQLQQKIGHVSDSVFDEKGNYLDSATVRKMLRTYEYGMSISKSENNPYRQTVRKLQPNQDEMDAQIRKMLPLQSTRLMEGAPFDFSPLATRYDLSKLNNKAVVLIFWGTNAKNWGKKLYNERGELNELTTRFRDTSKFEVIALTHEKIESGMAELKMHPIMNAFHIFGIPGTIEYYGTKQQPFVIITDRQHKIIFSVQGAMVQTPRFVFNYLKAL